MRHAVATAYQAFLTTLIVATCVYAYASSSLRERIENRLCDIRTRLAQTKMSSDDVAIVTISEADIAALRGVSGDPPPKDLGFDGLEHLLRVLRQSKARTIAVLLHAPVFPYDDDNGLGKIARLAAEDPRIIIGTNKFGRGDPTSGALPKALRLVPNQVGNIEASREFRRDIVREMIVENPDGIPYLIRRIAAQLGIDDRFQSLPVDEKGRRKLRLNYFNPTTITTLSASDVVAGRGLGDLAERNVLVGYVAFRPWDINILDATHLNSPWQNDGENIDTTSMPLVVLQAEALTNILRMAWLESAGLSTVVFQAVFIAGASLAIWHTTIGFACFLFIGGWALYLILNALMFSLLSLYVPLADTLAASVVAMTLGAVLRLRREGRHRAAAEARASSRAELASIQHRFLDRFTRELASINRRICELIAFELPPAPTSTLTTAHERLRASCSELEEYLIGMGQLGSLPGSSRRKPPLHPIKVEDVIHGLVRQFEARADEGKLGFEVTCKTGLLALADRYLLRQILFNLVSNAVKYSPPGGTIRIHAFRSQKCILISVADEGPGIAKEFHERIFEKFYRVKDDNVYKVKGHGLGLYLCRFFSEQIGASIAVSSTLGHGSTFTLNVRAANAKVAQ